MSKAVARFAKSNRRSFDRAALRSGRWRGSVEIRLNESFAIVAAVGIRNPLTEPPSRFGRCGFPPLRQKKGAKMGHGMFVPGEKRQRQKQPQVLRLRCAPLRKTARVIRDPSRWFTCNHPRSRNSQSSTASRCSLTVKRPRASSCRCRPGGRRPCRGWAAR